MFKKCFFALICCAMVFSAMPALAADSGQVCGIDGNNYASAAAAEAAGVDVSYEFACANPAQEAGLYEATTNINFAGMLVEVGSTDIPTNLIVRDNKTQVDYTVNVLASTVLGQRRDQTTNLSDWIPGDQIRVIGKKNENTGNVEASMLVNLSIKIAENKGANGWITKIDKETKSITYQWANKEYTFKYDGNTKFVAGLKNPASVDDLAVNDRIRARLLIRAGQDPVAKIVVVLRRGAALFMKIRTFTPRGTLVRMDSTIIPTTIQIKIEKTPGLKANDVNNLIGAEGALVTVNVTEDTQIVRKYFGKTALDELAIGDDLMIVGRVNDDGTVDAKLIKDNTIWKTSTLGHAGIVTEVNAAGGYLMMDWTPVQKLTRTRLKERLREADETVTAQTAVQANLRESLQARIKVFVAEKVGNFTRTIKQKKVQITRIEHNQVKIGDLIKRQPVKSIKVAVNEKTKIVVGTNANAAISDIKVNDKVRVRGTRNANSTVITADTIVVVSSLPEVEEPLTASLDDVNELVSEITTDDAGNAIVEDTTSSTEEEISGVETSDSGSNAVETESNSESNSTNSGDNSSSAADNNSSGNGSSAQDNTSDSGSEADNSEADSASGSASSSYVNSDLTVLPQSVTYRPVPATVGASIVFSATVQNIGEGDTGPFKTENIALNANDGDSDLYLRIDYNSDGSWDYTKTVYVPPLRSQKISLKNFSSGWKAVAGTHKYQLCADGGNDVQETNESNNCQEGTITVSE